MERDTFKQINATLKSQQMGFIEKSLDLRVQREGLKWKSPPAKVTARSPQEEHDARKALLRPETGPERYDLNLARDRYGVSIRYTLLARAFLKGVPYRTLEKSCEEDCSPYNQSVLGLCVFRTLSEALPESEKPNFTKEMVQVWITEGKNLAKAA